MMESPSTSSSSSSSSPTQQPLISSPSTTPPSGWNLARWIPSLPIPYYPRHAAQLLTEDGGSGQQHQPQQHAAEEREVAVNKNEEEERHTQAPDDDIDPKAVDDDYSNGAEAVMDKGAIAKEEASLEADATMKLLPIEEPDGSEAVHQHDDHDNENANSNKYYVPRKIGDFLHTVRSYIPHPYIIPSFARISLFRGAPGGSDASMSQEQAISLVSKSFEAKLKQPEFQELLETLTKFIVEFDTAVELEEQGRRVNTLIDELLPSALVLPNSPWALMPTEQAEAIVVECIEKYLLERLHSRIFLSEVNAANADAALFNRILSLRFISPRHLGILPQFEHLSWEVAQEALFMINSKKTPLEKLACLVKCAEAVLREVNSIYGGEIGADEFLPALIYAILKANPPLLHSNIKYISYFRHPSRMFAEWSYYFVNIVSAVSFIETLDASVLDIQPDDYDLGLKDPEALIEKEIMSGLRGNAKSSEGEEDDSSESNSWVYLKKTGQFLTVTQSRLVSEPLSKQAGTQTVESSRPHMCAAPSPLPSPSLETSHVQTEYPFLHSRAEDLSIDQIQKLLEQYKELVLYKQRKERKDQMD